MNSTSVQKLVKILIVSLNGCDNAFLAISLFSIQFRDKMKGRKEATDALQFHRCLCSCGSIGDTNYNKCYHVILLSECARTRSCNNRGHVWNSYGEEEEPFDQVSSIVSSRPEKGFLSLLSFTVHSTPTGIAKGCKWSSAVNSIQSNFSSASSSSSDWLCFGKKKKK